MPGGRLRIIGLSDRPTFFEALETILPALSCGAFALSTESPPPLFPEEEASIARAVPRRQLEFALGRWCARTALARLGKSNCPLPMEANRSPRWPEGFVGSITHCDGLVAAVVAPADRIEGIGLD